MTQGISKNPLNDISAVYLREIAEGRLKQLEKASALSASDDPADQDKAREIRVRHDYESLKKQISSKKKPTRAAVKEETIDEGGVHVVDGKKYLKLPRKIGKGVKRDTDERHELGKAKDAVTDALGITNTKRDGVRKHDGIKGQFQMQNSFSNWRSDLTLREITSDAKVVDDDGGDDGEPEIKEKKVKNKIKINPTFKESAEEFAQNLGGQLLEVAEVVDNDEDEDGEPDNKKVEMMKKKEAMLKKRIVRMKMMAVNQTGGEGIIASYEPDIEGAVEYFYEEGLNEEGIDQLIEEIGIEEFVNFVDESAVDLNEERAARRATVRAKKYDVVKKEVDKADAARRKAKKGEYAPSYAKKETDVTVYDDKPSAKKKTPVKKAPVKKSKKDYDGDGKKETPKAEHRGVRNKKITKAVAKVKKTQPKKKATKQGLGDKIRTAYKAGVKRHRKATQGARVFGKGFAAGAKKAVKFAKDVKKVVSEEELDERLGGKGYKRRKDYAGRTVEGDWEDSDRGEGNKAKRRSGRQVDAKSPTYLAHVKNKKKANEEVEVAESKGHKGDDSFIEGETGSKRARRNLTRAMSSTTAGMGKPAEDTIKRRKRHQEDRGKKTKGTAAGHSGSAYPKMSKTLDDTYPHKKTYRLKQKMAARKAGKKYQDDTHHSLKKKTVGEKLPKSRNEEVQFEDRSIFKKAMSKVFKKKQEEKKPQKAMDAGARAKRLLARQVHAKYVSGSTENVPDDIRDHYEVENLKEYSPNVTYQAKGGRKSGKLGKSSVYSLKDKGESKKEFRKSQVKDIKGGYLKTEEVVDEAKVDKGRSDYGKATIRNWRHSGPSTVEPAMFDPENKRGKTIEKRREEHKARRGVKGAKVPAYKVSEEKKKGLDGKACWKGYKLAGTKKKGGKTVDNCVKEEDKAFNYVVAKLRKQHGKDAVITKDSPKPKPPSAAQKAKSAAERKKRQDADNKAYASRAKKAGFKSTQDYTDVVARYGSEDNYKKGKGLGT